MDWSKADPFEMAAYNLGSVMLVTLACAAVVAAFWLIYKLVSRLMRVSRTTHALKCKLCVYNKQERNDSLGEYTICERFGVNTSNAPVMNPGCTWGKESK